MRVICTLITILILGLAISGQAPKPRSLDAIDADISQVKADIDKAKKERVALLVKYTETSPEVKGNWDVIDSLEMKLSILQTERAKAAPSPISPVKFNEAQQKILLHLISAKLGMSMCGVSPESPECKKEDWWKMYADAIAKAVDDPAIAMHLLSSAVSDYEGIRSGTRSAAQVSQIADQQNVELMRLMVAQNQRMIQLLEQILRKKP